MCTKGRCLIWLKGETLLHVVVHVFKLFLIIIAFRVIEKYINLTFVL